MSFTETQRKLVNSLLIAGEYVTRAQMQNDMYGAGVATEKDAVYVNLTRLGEVLAEHGIKINKRKIIGYSLSLDDKAKVLALLKAKNFAQNSNVVKR